LEKGNIKKVNIAHKLQEVFSKKLKKLVFFLKNIFNAVKQNKFHSIFSILAIAAAISSVVLIVCAIEGSSYFAKKLIEKMGSDIVFVAPGTPKSDIRKLKLKYFTFKDLEALKKIPYTYFHTGALAKWVLIKSYNGKNYDFALVYGNLPNMFKAWNINIDYGRALSEKDRYKRVCVIGHYLAKEIFGKDDGSIIGKKLLINNVPIKVIGIYEKLGIIYGENEDNRLYMPIYAYRQSVEPDYKHLSILVFKVKDIKKVDWAAKQAEEILFRLHKEKDFTVYTPGLVKKLLNMLSATLAFFLGIAVFVSIIVGGFVLSNIFYLNVQSRRWEIGLRRALGAKKRDILFLFLSEALILSFFGLILGLFIGYYGSKALIPKLGIPYIFSKKVFIFSALTSILIALFSAYKPAKEASEYEPVFCLREKV